jgi:hypothetical protein
MGRERLPIAPPPMNFYDASLQWLLYHGPTREAYTRLVGTSGDRVTRFPGASLEGLQKEIQGGIQWGLEDYRNKAAPLGGIADRLTAVLLSVPGVQRFSTSLDRLMGIPEGPPITERAPRPRSAQPDLPEPDPTIRGRRSSD